MKLKIGDLINHIGDNTRLICHHKFKSNGYIWISDGTEYRGIRCPLCNTSIYINDYKSSIKITPALIYEAKDKGSNIFN
jgi:hypothetical protein